MFTKFKFSPHNLLRLFSLFNSLFALCLMFPIFQNHTDEVGQFNKRTWKRSNRRKTKERMEKVTVLHSYYIYVCWMYIRYKKRIIYYAFPLSFPQFHLFLILYFFLFCWTLAFWFKGHHRWPLTIVTNQHIFTPKCANIFLFLFYRISNSIYFHNAMFVCVCVCTLHMVRKRKLKMVVECWCSFFPSKNSGWKHRQPVMVRWKPINFILIAQTQFKRAFENNTRLWYRWRMNKWMA